jgi:ABC-type antimicrobial peptide transport system permease subunit
VTGAAPDASVKAVKVTQPLKVGISVELTQGIRTEGMPHIFMTVLEMPSKDTAIIAVGTKEVAQS